VAYREANPARHTAYPADLSYQSVACPDQFTAMAQMRKPWTREELILAFNLYCRTPFGKIHSTHPAVVELAKYIGRTPSAVSMKMCNFATLDPAQQKRNIKGLAHGSKQDFLIWEEFNENWEGLALQSQTVLSRLNIHTESEAALDREFAETETSRTVRARLVQRFFRDAVLSSYDYTCAMCHLKILPLLNASHIVPWSKDKSLRANPRNGLCLCALHDRAFDRGLITVANDNRILVSSRLKAQKPCLLHQAAFESIEGKPILLPHKFKPDAKAIEYHRDMIFLS